MRTVYIDNDFHCHVYPTGTPIETDVFDGKCDAFIEGFLYVPKGMTWVRSDGVEFPGLWYGAWKPYEELDAAQREYEREQMADMENALAILLGGEAE